MKVTVGSVDATGITTRFGTKYELTDILTVERQQFNGVKTGFLVAGVVGGALFLYIAAAVGGAYGSFWGGS